MRGPETTRMDEPIYHQPDNTHGWQQARREVGTRSHTEVRHHAGAGARNDTASRLTGEPDSAMRCKGYWAVGQATGREENQPFSHSSCTWQQLSCWKARARPALRAANNTAACRFRQNSLWIWTYC